MSELYKKFNQIINKKIKDKIEEELLNMGEILVEYTVPVTPKEYGSLRSTIRAETESDNKFIKMQVGVAGNFQGKKSPNAPTGYVDYAIVMHEDLSYTPKTPGTGPKYLEKTVKKYEQSLLTDFIENIKL